MKRITRWAVITGIVVATGAAVPSVANADDSPSGQEFGQHVATCAQMMGGFDGEHNSGMHRGFAGWNGTTC